MVNNSNANPVASIKHTKHEWDESF
jgi:hypothetical protein